MNPLLTPGELAQILKVSTGHIYRLVAQRKVPFIKNGGSVRFRPESIERWVQNQEVVSVRDVLRGRK